MVNTPFFFIRSHIKVTSIISKFHFIPVIDIGSLIP